MRYAKYILIFIAIYYGIEFHSEYLDTKKEVASIEDAYKDKFDGEYKEYELNTENNTFDRDSANLLIDQKYLKLEHDIKVQYLQEKLNYEIYSTKLQELEEHKSEETVVVIDAWLAKHNSNNYPSAPVPALLYEKRNRSEDNSNALFSISGLLLAIFLWIDILAWQKYRRQLQIPTQKNNQDTLINPKNQLKAGKFEQSNNQMFYNGQTLTRQTLTLENGDVIDDWVNERGNLINVPEEITIEWDKQREAESN